MGVFKLGKMTFGSLFKKPETVLYPLEKKPQPLGLKGHIVLNVDDCILCGMCEKGCPTDCITVDKAARTWSCIPFQCIQCGYCTQICPKKCLAMDPNYWTAAVSKEANVVAVPDKAIEAAPAVKDTPKAEAPAQDAKTAVKEAVADAETESSSAFELDEQLAAKIALMDDDKAERVRKALTSR